MIDTAYTLFLLLVGAAMACALWLDVAMVVGLGLLRFRDFPSRMHAATKASGAAFSVFGGPVTQVHEEVADRRDACESRERLGFLLPLKPNALVSLLLPQASSQMVLISVPFGSGGDY